MAKCKNDAHKLRNDHPIDALGLQDLPFNQYSSIKQKDKWSILQVQIQPKTKKSAQSSWWDSQPVCLTLGEMQRLPHQTVAAASNKCCRRTRNACA
ncbi:hypothetical protein L1049_011574 [Liquidambar formosana]|uniref:Uncharacterized protein n=1 Tax=Liquidambar formosana TaxID=63359 RepID=A0AAP0RRU1_LIQFO